MIINKTFSHYILLLLTIFTIAFSFNVYAKEYGVSERSIVVGGAENFNDTQIYDFKVSGGEVLGSATPLRAYVTIEGVYEGGGSVRAYYDGNVASGETFILPNTGDAETLQLVLGDKLHLLDTDNAGDYNHKLYLEPVGVTIASASVHVSTMYSRDLGNKCEDGQSDTTKSKTIEYFIANNESISGLNTYTINYGLNDDLSSIPNPISSAYIEIVGLYTSAGTIDVYFENKAVDGISHQLPQQGNQRQFSILSKNINNLIQQESGTDFTQDLKIDTNGITLSSVSIKLILTYKYHPMKSSCGGFPATGTFTSPTLDTRSPLGVLYNSIAWKGELGGDFKDTGKVRFQIATAKCLNGSSNPPDCNIGSFNFIGGATCSSSDWFESRGPGIPIDIFKSGCSSSLDGNQYYRYKVQICAKDCIDIGLSTPTVNGVYVSWSP